MPGVRTPGSGVARSPRCGHREAAAGSRAWPSLLLTCEIAGTAPRPESPKDPGPAQRPPQSAMRWRRCALDRGSARAPGRGPEGRAEARAEHRRALAETSRARLRSQQGHGDQRVPPHTYVRAPSCPGAGARAPHPVPAPASAPPLRTLGSGRPSRTALPRPTKLCGRLSRPETDRRGSGHGQPPSRPITRQAHHRDRLHPPVHLVLISFQIWSSIFLGL